MRFESKLCHISDNKAVVQVNGWLNDRNIGSALAEGQTVEIAEDNAISRLEKRLNLKINSEPSIIKEKDNIDKFLPHTKVELPKSEKIESDNIIQEPKDWSTELTDIDSEIKRLNWSRDDESIFIQKKLGLNNRGKITKYNELVKYLNLLKNLNYSNSSKPNINELMNYSDNILKELNWDYKQGREYLQKEFNVSSRKDLDKDQLISFIEKLKTIRNQDITK